MLWRNRISGALLMLILLQAGQVVLAQGDTPACTPLIEQRLNAVREGCSALDADTACFGADVVNASLVDVAPDDFNEAGDRISLAGVQSLQTAALDPELEQWGMAVLNTQAGVPVAHAGPGLTFIMLGDVTVENLVDPASAVQMAEPVMVTTLVQTNVRDLPSANSTVIASAPTGTQLAADALSGDSAWVRVMYEGRVAWMSRDLVASESPLDVLPVMGASSRALMQEFTFTTGSGLAECDGAIPALLVVQGPRGIPVEFVANGAEIRLGSTAALWISSENEMHVMVLSGGAQVGNVPLPAGFTTKAALTADGRAVDGPWQNVRPMTDGERAILQRLELLPVDVMSYAIEIPSQADVQQTLIAISSSGAGASSGPASGRAECDRLQPTSPLGGMAFNQETFYWDGALGANDYRVNLYNEGGAQIGSFSTNSDNTALTINVSPDAIGAGFSFAWEVQALVDGQVACTSARIPVLRQAGVQLAGEGDGGDPDNVGQGPWD